MRTIYKYSLDPGINIIELPEGAQILSTAAALSGPVLYAAVNPDEQKKVPVTVYVYGTGPQSFHHDMPEPDVRGLLMMFIGTVNCQGLMWHVFVRNPEMN